MSRCYFRRTVKGCLAEYFRYAACMVVVAVGEDDCRYQFRRDLQYLQIVEQGVAGTGIEEISSAVVVAAVYGQTVFSGQRCRGTVVHYDLKVPRHTVLTVPVLPDSSRDRGSG